ncbi:U-box domain-containing protein 7 [Zea mays]|uniref:RING-type E3 ubiquitin transferase n=1 Tax=Zea mays TaxID=4577 RepID=A0A1D6J8Y4_MAIZE|nr:U-box domain-containing protein 7 [Zea mays]
MKGLSRSMPLPPEELRCPISLQLIYDPVVITSGQTYERACIEKWFDSGNTTCPKTRKQLSQLLRTPNYCIKGLIASWCEQNGVPAPSGPPESPELDHMRISCLESSTCVGTDGANTVLFEETAAKDDAKSDMEIFSRQNSGEATSKLRVDEVSPENCFTLQSSKEAAPETCGVVDSLDKGKGSHQDSKDDVPVSERCEQWLHVLNKNDAESMSERLKLVEQIRILLKNDDELRDYAGANGITEPLIHFLKMAIYRGDVRSQEVATMALFNFAVNNDRNKRLLLSAGVIPLIEQMIQERETCEAAIAMYLNLSCIPEAQAIIGSSVAIPFLVNGLGEGGSRSDTCRLDALLTLYNVICSGDDGSSQTVLQEGVIPALVSVTANGTARARDKAQRLLRLFREQRQRELELEEMQPRVELHEVASQAAARQEEEEEEEEEMALAVTPAAAASKPRGGGKKPRLRRSGSRRFTKAFTCLLKKWSLR